MPNSRYAVGVMSGTSLDGVDAACCRVTRTGDDPFDYEVDVESFITEPYDAAVRDRLVRLCSDETGRVDEVCRMNVALGDTFAAAALRAVDEAGLTPPDVAVVGSHGQTIWHIPDEEPLPGRSARSRSTLQIGDGGVIADRTGISTVTDFRTRDVAAGGHGAPLASFLDAVLFADDDQTRAVQNIGGIGNCTLVPPDADQDDAVAFDTGPGNMVVDAVVEVLTDGDQTYDDNGAIAADGNVDEEFLAVLLDDPYFAETPPKSTGREQFGHDYARELITAGREHGLGNADLVATATALTARSIADAYDRFAPATIDEVVVSGGGAHNATLMKLLRDAVDAAVVTLDQYGVGVDEKESALFALLAVARLDGVPNNVPRSTGAREAVIMGKVSQP